MIINACLFRGEIKHTFTINKNTLQINQEFIPMAIIKEKFDNQTLNQNDIKDYLLNNYTDNLIRFNLHCHLPFSDKKCTENCENNVKHNSDIRMFYFCNHQDDYLHFISVLQFHKNIFAIIVYEQKVILKDSTVANTENVHDDSFLLNPYLYKPYVIIYINYSFDKNENFMNKDQIKDKDIENIAINNIYKIAYIDRDKWIPANIAANDLSTYPILKETTFNKQK